MTELNILEAKYEQIGDELYIYIYDNRKLVLTLRLKKSGNYYKLQCPYKHYNLLMETT